MHVLEMLVNKERAESYVRRNSWGFSHSGNDGFKIGHWFSNSEMALLAPLGPDWDAPNIWRVPCCSPSGGARSLFMVIPSSGVLAREQHRQQRSFTFRCDCKDLFIYQHGDCEELETCQDAGSQPWHRTRGSPAASSSLHCLPKLPGMPAWATPTCPSEPLLPTGRAPDQAKAAGDRLVYPHPDRVHHQSRPDPRRDPV